MLKWSGLLVRLGGGRQPHFSEDFFSRLDQDILVVDDYRYAGIYFRNDLDLVLPEGYDWDASLGMLDLLFLSSYIFFDVFSFFICFWCLTQFSFLVQIVHRCDRPVCLRLYGGVLLMEVRAQVAPLESTTQIWTRWRNR